MKILLFKGTNIEPFRVYHRPDDVTICNDGTVTINEIGRWSSFEFLHLQTELVECDESDQRELCLLLFLEEQAK